MKKYTRRHRSRRSRRISGAGYQASQQYFNPEVFPPHVANGAEVSSAPTNEAIRPVLASTFAGGRRRKTRKGSYKGGFSPSVMGPFLKNAQAAVVPLAFYTLYHMMPKKGRNISSPSRRSRK